MLNDRIVIGRILYEGIERNICIAAGYDTLNNTFNAVLVEYLIENTGSTLEDAIRNLLRRLETEMARKEREQVAAALMQPGAGPRPLHPQRGNTSDVFLDPERIEQPEVIASGSAYPGSSRSADPSPHLPWCPDVHQPPSYSHILLSVAKTRQAPLSFQLQAPAFSSKANTNRVPPSILKLQSPLRLSSTAETN
jgi:hypothetical protein